MDTERNIAFWSKTFMEIKLFLYLVLRQALMQVGNNIFVEIN